MFQHKDQLNKAESCHYNPQSLKTTTQLYQYSTLSCVSPYHFTANSKMRTKEIHRETRHHLLPTFLSGNIETTVKVTIRWPCNHKGKLVFPWMIRICYSHQKFMVNITIVHSIKYYTCMLNLHDKEVCSQ